MYYAVTLLRTLVLLTAASLAPVALAAESSQPLSGSSSSSAVYEQLSAPKGYLTICNYGDSCAVTKPKLVAFGSHGQYVYKVVSGAFLCSERTFNRSPASISDAQCSVAGSASKQQEPTASHISATEVSNGKYVIVSRHSGKALTIDENGNFSQAPLTGDQSQQFFLNKREDGYFTINTVGDRALEVKDWVTSDGAKVKAAAPVESWSQQWSLSDAETGHISITSRFSGKALDLAAINTQDSAAVRLWTYWGGKNQQWQLIPAK